MYILSYPKNELEEDVKVKCRSRLKGINTKAHMSELKKNSHTPYKTYLPLLYFTLYREIKRN